MSDSIFVEIPEHSHTEVAGATDWPRFIEVVKSRRSVRVFDATPIPEEDVRDCLRAALLAPNSSNLQCWEFYWVRSAQKKAKLVEACFSQPAARTAAELIVCVARIDTWKRNANWMLELLEKEKSVPRSVHKYYKTLVPFVYMQGPLSIFGAVKRVLFFFAGLVRPVPREPVSRGQLISWATKSTALACENLMLAFRAKGYDSCPMEGMDSIRVRKILGLPRSATITMVVSAGTRAANGVYGPQIRFDEKNFLFEV